MERETVVSAVTMTATYLLITLLILHPFYHYYYYSYSENHHLSIVNACMMT